MRKIGSVCVILCLFLAFASYVNAAERPIRILLLEPLSGPAKDNGDRSLIGAEFAAAELNAAGGILGRKIEVVGEDSQSKPDVAVRKLQKYLLDQSVDIVIVCSGTPVAKAVVEATKGANVLALLGTMADETTGADFENHVFRPYNNTSQAARAIVTYLAKYKNFKKFYLLNQDYSFGRDTGAAFRKEIKKQIPDGQVVGEDYFPLFSKDLSPFLTKVKVSGADAILSSAWGGDINLLLKQRVELGVKAVIADMALAPPIAIQANVDAAQGAIATDMYVITADTKENKDFVKRYRDKYKGTLYPEPDALSARTYLFTQLAMSAAKKAKSLNLDKIVPALEGMRERSLLGEVWIRPCDHQIQAPMAVVEINSTKYPYYGAPTVLPMSATTIEESATGNPRCKGK
jgi:branched-chain amino acid transport system substrate-binding protein